MSLIQVSNLTFCYEGSYDPVFQSVSFELDTDWKLGFIGRNGQGKTTFLQLLMGRYEYEGSITASVEFDYFPFPAPDPELTTMEVVRQRAPELELWRLLWELSLLRVSDDVLYRPFSTLSNGERTKVLLALLFSRENRFLLLDEPTNHLDLEAREGIVRYLKGKKGFILVSHDRTLLDQCVDHILSINRADIQVQKGNFSAWRRNKEMQDQYELEKEARLNKEIRRMDAAARRTADWSDQVEKSKQGAADRGYVGHKAAKMMKRSKNVQRRRDLAAQEKRSLLRNLDTAEPLKLHPLTHHASRLAEISGLSIRYGDRVVCAPPDFTVSSGERVALVGKNGCGKTSLLRLVAGEDVPHTGTVRTPGGLILSVVEQDAETLSGGLKEYAAARGVDPTLLFAVLRKLDFSRVQLEKDLKQLSGGQKKKVMLAMSLCRPAHLYLWDEPLNFIDLPSRMQIEELILAYQPTLLFVEHDAAFTQKVATRQVIIEGE
ncbi:MAG: ABC-F type ribosomal protection protein [Clostridiales bacterium]|jgi:lincosamide and streptogramin A transport system ATP-binding/permease protein|nr:ABC-F type ribosomal protection protein [Clostridiales bacterium]